MELESNKYKRRLIGIVIILIIATILGTIAEKEIKKNADTVDEIVQVIQGTKEDDYNALVEKRKSEGQNIEKYTTKEEALSTFQKIQSYYDSIYKYQEFVVIFYFSISLCGSIMAIMMYFIFAGWIINKIWQDIKSWLSVLVRILLFIILIPIPLIQYILILIGVFGQLPFAAYTLYKYIKTKKAEDKDDVIIEK